jgi:hypothetical protein
MVRCRGTRLALPTRNAPVPHAACLLGASARLPRLSLVRTAPVLETKPCLVCAMRLDEEDGSTCCVLLLLTFCLAYELINY